MLESAKKKKPQLFGGGGGEKELRKREAVWCPYIFPAASWSPGNDIQEGVGQIAVIIEGVVPTAQRDVAKIPARFRNREDKPDGEETSTKGKTKQRFFFA